MPLTLTYTGPTTPANGAGVSGGTGMSYSVVVSGSWVQGDEYTISLTSTLTNVVIEIGAGFVTGVAPTFVFTYDQKVYALDNATVYTSAIQSAKVWNDPNGTGNGFVVMSDFFNIQEPLVSVAPFQGRLAFFSPYCIQLWVVDPLIINWQQVQVLTNIGTNASQSVQGLGDFDVLFLHSSGFRSLRVILTTLQGEIEDMGSSVDMFLQGIIGTNGLTSVANSCGIVDPQTRRYMCFVPNSSDANGVGKIWVLSYFKSSKVQAWSTYDPSYLVGSTVTYFTPQIWGVFLGQVVVRDTSNNIYFYGGSGNQYDHTTMTIQTPFFDMERPGNIKNSLAIDVDVSQLVDAVNHPWNVYLCADWIDGTLTNEAPVGQPTYDTGYIGAQLQGTHFSMELTTSDASQATLSSAVLYYNLGNSPAGD